MNNTERNVGVVITGYNCLLSLKLFEMGLNSYGLFFAGLTIVLAVTIHVRRTKYAQNEEEDYL